MSSYVKLASAFSTTGAFALVGGLAISLDVLTIDYAKFIQSYKIQELTTNSNVLTQYKVTNGKLDAFQNIKVIHKFASNLLENIEDLDPEFSKVIDENYWNLI